MRLPDDVKKLVVYLGIENPQAGAAGMDAAGTGFLVTYESPNSTYIVTAAHVAHALEDGPFGVRLNDKEGRARIDQVDSVKWWFHPEDTAVDVAVMQYEPPQWADKELWITKWSISEGKRVTKNIGAGDLAHIVGWYKYRPGEKKNTPIVHTGHIAMMDDEPISAPDWRDRTSKPKDIRMDGYLVEASTLKGLSGAPVFVRRSLPTKMHIPALDSHHLKVWLHGSLWLLGLWRGAWFGEPAEEHLKAFGVAGRVSVGMGVVVPARKIIEVLNQPGLVALRKKATMSPKAVKVDQPVARKRVRPGN